jgi:hypothetical protein
MWFISKTQIGTYGVAATEPTGEVDGGSGGMPDSYVVGHYAEFSIDKIIKLGDINW